MSAEFDEQYAHFVDLIDSKTPQDAVNMLSMFGVPDALIQQIRERHELEAIKVRERDSAQSVVLDNRSTWYTGPQTNDTCWPVLIKQLGKKDWSRESIGALDRSSTQVVSLLNHPKEKQFSTRGLVVGHVQSGKTTNFTAVMAKAADRNYKLFIVLAGIHNGLRRQTQLRLVQDLITPNAANWMQLTVPEKDFTAPANAAAYFAKSNKQHVLCVIKKNAAVLRRFRQWLDTASGYLVDCPALIIDDEADQATVATKTINPLIRDIMDRLPKSAYVGYTATPFANLLIDPAAKDLYPRDFIVSLPKPDGHFGTEVLFGRDVLDGEDPEDVDDGYDMIREIQDHEVDLVRPRTRAEKDDFEPVIGDALRDAIHYFWLNTAARRVRGSGTKHATMLIHTSVNTAIHNSFRDPLTDFRAEAESLLASGDSELLDELRELWGAESAKVPALEFGHTPVSFDELLVELSRVIADCEIILDNASSKVRLDYEGDPVVAIAVGGNTLSRGLTLEGLSVSYFVRSVSAYDTLLQMGRWFGYRTGYEDLPRVWMTAELRDWFRHLATVESEIRRDIGVYMVEDKRPTTFAVRIRTHPSLRVTAAAKMKDSVRAASAYGGQRIQTRYFDLDTETLLGNQSAARQLIAEVIANRTRDDHAPMEGRYLWRGVPFQDVLKFIQSYSFHAKSQECDANLLAQYINQRVNRSALRKWNVAIVGKKPSGGSDTTFDFAPGIDVERVTRAKLKDSGVIDIKTLMSRRDAAIDLDVSGVAGELSEAAIVQLRREQASDTGLLVLYPIDKDSVPGERTAEKRVGLNAPEHVIGVGLVFPTPSGDDSEVEWEYVSADLSGIEIEEADLSELELEEI
ncbi:Z1 domain-containing protein [Rhodococcus sp. TAF43]|uniref:Z1 domain-containing protein n=1 Tax=Rhodococcus sp. TAF43 TaxID=3237483 RepID=UPI003F9747BF